ncbi:MAG: 2,3-bisphosphoglycerate-independent phosphoglycerate mutase [Candidatus Parcubacteria bacterium]|nr:2,3-bisphosphoglycerate-independent phosphoglycerate mutase [Candidatus Parcubacteria bacterium]
MNTRNSAQKPVMLIILDGWGQREDTKDNAVAAAKKPFFDMLWNEYPHSLLKASGDAVGLPEGQMGNSEVGHMTIGAGTPIDTDLVRIDKSIRTGEFDENPHILALFDHVKKHGSTLHVQGLLSDGGVHSHQNHLFAFLRLAKKQNVPKVAIHVFTDGRDTPPQSASAFLKELEAVLEELNSEEPKAGDPSKPQFFIATLSGRYYAMDRDNNWDRLAKVEQALFECKGAVCEIKPSLYMEERYKTGAKDELIEPIVMTTPHGVGARIGTNDGVFFFNFRADRARMISEKLIAAAKKDNIHFLTLTEYSSDFDCPTAFTPKTVEATLGEELAKAGMKQSRIAETEKFPHATYFLNGGRDLPHEGQTNIMLASRKDVKTHDEAPEMRAEAIADKAIEEIRRGDVDFIFMNFANPDMVGHTANVPAIITAIETVDAQLKRVIEALNEAGGVAIVTADHGNAEINVDQETGEKHTAHTLSLVPCIITSKKYALRDGGLADLAPTVLELLGLKKHASMEGSSLLVK